MTINKFSNDAFKNTKHSKYKILNSNSEELDIEEHTILFLS